MIQSFNLNEFDYKKERSMLVKPHNDRFPAELFVESHRTHRVVRFIHITPAHPMYDQDGWDGEQAVYEPAFGEAKTNVKVLVLHHF